MNNTHNNDQKIPQNPPAGHQPAQPVNYQQTHVPPTQTQNLNPEADRVHNQKPHKSSRRSGLISIAQLIAGAVILALVLNNFVFQSYKVFGESMTDTLQNGDHLLISKVSKTISNFTGEYRPSRGDIVVFTKPTDESVQLIKRVIGLPGERVVVADGKITVYNDEYPNGFNPDGGYDEFLPPSTSGNIDTVVAEDSVFVSGDNRRLGGSLDSRNELGNVPIDNIIGELVLRIFPLSNSKFF